MDRDKFIEGLGEVLTDEAVDAASEDRALLLEGLKHLERGELDEAVKVFRRAQRHLVVELVIVEWYDWIEAASRSAHK